MATGISRRDFMVTTAATVAAGACTGKDTEANAAAPKARADLYHCEGCDAVFERDAKTLGWDVDIARGEPGEPMIAEGVVRAADGGAPVAGVIVYLHQTNAKGLYANGTSETEWSRRHGRLRGWAVTDSQGRYRFRTIKPAPYPDMTMPAHIHLMVGEPGRRPYYIDDIVFDGEFKVDDAYRSRQEFRGGGGIVKLSKDAEGRWIARRDIILERHP